MSETLSSADCYTPSQYGFMGIHSLLAGSELEWRQEASELLSAAEREYRELGFRVGPFYWEADSLIPGRNPAVKNVMLGWVSHMKRESIDPDSILVEITSTVTTEVKPENVSGMLAEMAMALSEFGFAAQAQHIVDSDLGLIEEEDKPLVYLAIGKAAASGQHPDLGAPFDYIQKAYAASNANNRFGELYEIGPINDILATMKLAEGHNNTAADLT